mmetsp:Transcript_15940/g.34371  ORF Transcript_15940/g.34371 Transcript_15940/m.34371 type:complete len:265 (+) Transcript_15940:355-1149(+)
MRPPATLISYPIWGGRGSEINNASHPGSSGLSPTSIIRTGPANRKFCTVTGIFAPKDDTLISKSARAFDFQSISKSKAISQLPKSNNRASRILGATSPIVNFFSMSFFIWALSFATSSNASCNADSNGAVSIDGKIRSNMYWMGIKPGTPTAAEYICVSFLIASTLSVKTRLTSPTPSLKACSAAGNLFLNPLICSFPRSTSIVNCIDIFITLQFLLYTIPTTSLNLLVFSFPNATIAATNAATVLKNNPPSINDIAKLKNGAL